MNIYFGSLKWEKSSFHFKASKHFEKAEWTKGKLDKLIWLYKHVNFMKLRNTTLKTKKQTMENIYKRWILNGLCLNSDVQSCILLFPKTCSIQGLPSQLVALPLSSHSRGQKPGVVRAPPPTPVQVQASMRRCWFFVLTYPEGHLSGSAYYLLHHQVCPGDCKSLLLVPLVPLTFQGAF